jgi:excinuclease UvrABC ATPase subunit
VPSLKKNFKHNIDVVIDRLVVKKISDKDWVKA